MGIVPDKQGTGDIPRNLFCGFDGGHGKCDSRAMEEGKKTSKAKAAKPGDLIVSNSDWHEACTPAMQSEQGLTKLLSIDVLVGKDGTVTGNRIGPARSSCAIHVTSYNGNRELIVPQRHPE